MNWSVLLSVALGSALGGSIRYLVGLLMQSSFSSTKHFHPTLFVNMLGCFLIGILFSQAQKDGWGDKTTGFLLIGLLGGFTTFSSFGLDTIRLIQNGETLQALLYVFYSVIGGLVGVYLGIMLTKG